MPVQSFKVFIIEDDLEKLEYYSDIVEKAELPCKGVSKREELIRILPREEPFILVTDLNLKLSNGLEIVRELKRQDYVFEYLVVSGTSDASVMREVFIEGAVDFLAKSSNLEQFELQMLSALRRAQVKLVHSYQIFAAPIRKLLKDCAARDAQILFLDVLGLRDVQLNGIDDMPEGTIRSIRSKLKKKFTEVASEYGLGKETDLAPILSPVLYAELCRRFPEVAFQFAEFESIYVPQDLK